MAWGGDREIKKGCGVSAALLSSLGLWAKSHCLWLLFLNKNFATVKKHVLYSMNVTQMYYICHVTCGISCVTSLSFTNPLLWNHGIVKCLWYALNLAESNRSSRYFSPTVGYCEFGHSIFFTCGFHLQYNREVCTFRWRCEFWICDGCYVSSVYSFAGTLEWFDYMSIPH